MNNRRHWEPRRWLIWASGSIVAQVPIYFIIFKVYIYLTLESVPLLDPWKCTFTWPLEVYLYLTLESVPLIDPWKCTFNWPLKVHLLILETVHLLTHESVPSLTLESVPSLCPWKCTFTWPLKVYLYFTLECVPSLYPWKCTFTLPLKVYLYLTLESVPLLDPRKCTFTWTLKVYLYWPIKCKASKLFFWGGLWAYQNDNDEVVSFIMIHQDNDKSVWKKSSILILSIFPEMMRLLHSFQMALKWNRIQ